VNPSFSKRYQFKILAFLSLSIALLGTILYLRDSVIYEGILGEMHPLLALQFIIPAYFLLFLYLLSYTPLRIYQNKGGKAYGLLAGISLVFGLEVIAADLWWAEYPLDLNVAAPDSFLYYPVMGFMAEAVFHLLPLTFFIFILSNMTSWPMNRVLWVSIALTALAEPFFQILAGPESDFTTQVYTGIHVFLFSLAQLWVFKKYDFVSMYLVRLLFYAIWHIGWGELRIEILVPGS